MPLYAIGDIHGYTDQLTRALSLIAADGGAAAPIVFVGDYVDRGPDAKGVIQMLMDGQQAGRDWTCLIGNHDLLFWRFVLHGQTIDAHIKSGKGWLYHRLGGNATLISYLGHATAQSVSGVVDFADQGLDPVDNETAIALQKAARAAVPQSHLDWISAQPRLHVAQDHVFVHAGLRVGVPLDQQIEADLTWIRDGWIDNLDAHPQMVVHGHTALDFPKHHGNRINIDGGAGYGRPLVPCVLDDGLWFTLGEDGRHPLAPY